MIDKTLSADDMFASMVVFRLTVSANRPMFSIQSLSKLTTRYLVSSPPQNPVLIGNIICQILFEFIHRY